MTYGDTNNKVAHTYDAIGNPLTDCTWTYTWEKGRQLKQMTKSGTTATFLYNADGLRIRKTVGSTVTNYTLHGKNIVHMTQGSNTLHFWYDAQNRPAIVQFNGTKYGYIVNLQGDVLGLVDTSGNEVVKYVYDAWGKILSTTGSLASTLGTIQPFRYRGYVYDEETGLYYLRSRYYCPVLNRFLNADSIINENVFGYCKNNVVRCFDINGTDTQVFFDLGHPITSPVLSTNKFGTHDLKEKIPQQYVISALIQMCRDPNRDNKAWTYHHVLDYGQVDCNSIVRMICKTFYTRSAYNSLGLGYTVESVVGALQISAPIPITDKDAIPACSIVISKDYSHMGMTIGPYESSKNAVVESAVRYGGAHISKNWTVGSGTRDFFYYCQVTIFDYESDIEHTGPRYLTMEDDP